MYYSCGSNSRWYYTLWVYRTVKEGNFSFHIIWKISFYIIWKMPVGDLRFYVNETILKTYLLKIAFLNFVISHFVSPHLKLAFLEFEMSATWKLKLVHWTNYG